MTIECEMKKKIKWKFNSEIIKLNKNIKNKK